MYSRSFASAEFSGIEAAKAAAVFRSVTRRDSGRAAEGGTLNCVAGSIYGETNTGEINLSYLRSFEDYNSF